MRASSSDLPTAVNHMAFADIDLLFLDPFSRMCVLRNTEMSVLIDKIHGGAGGFHFGPTFAGKNHLNVEVLNNGTIHFRSQPQGWMSK